MFYGNKSIFINILQTKHDVFFQDILPTFLLSFQWNKNPWKFILVDDFVICILPKNLCNAHGIPETQKFRIHRKGTDQYSLVLNKFIDSKTMCKMGCSSSVGRSVGRSVGIRGLWMASDAMVAYINDCVFMAILRDTNSLCLTFWTSSLVLIQCVRRAVVVQ